MKKFTTINTTEAKVLLNENGYRIRKIVSGRVTTSVSLPVDVADKLDAIKNKYNVNRSAFVAMLIKSFEL